MFDQYGIKLISNWVYAFLFSESKSSWIADILKAQKIGKENESFLSSSSSSQQAHTINLLIKKQEDKIDFFFERRRR